MDMALNRSLWMTWSTYGTTQSGVACQKWQRRVLMLFQSPNQKWQLSLSLHFNGYFPGEPGLAGVHWSKGWWRWWWQLDYWSYKSCKAPGISSPPTNQHPVFLQARCPSCRPTNSVKAMKEKYHIPWTCSSQAHLGSSNFVWPLIAPGYFGGGLPCPSSALWCQYPGVKHLCTPVATNECIKQLHETNENTLFSFPDCSRTSFFSAICVSRCWTTARRDSTWSSWLGSSSFVREASAETAVCITENTSNTLTLVHRYQWCGMVWYTRV